MTLRRRDVLRGALKVGRVEWSLTGEHNQLNALAAIAAAESVGVSAEQACTALGAFQNVKRRMECVGTVQLPGGEVRVYDDFAHHPTAIRTTINGLRRQIDRQTQKGGAPGRVLALFEPRSNTMKLGTMRAQLADSLRGADLVYCYRGGLSWHPGENLAALGDRACVESDLDQLVERIATDARAGDRVLVMSNGGFGGIHQRLLAALGAPR